MGTQQILMIVLSVIVVGAAVAVGIQMFDTQSNNQARNAVTSEVSQLAIQAQAWFRTPSVMGGGEGTFAAGDFPRLMRFIDQTIETNTLRTPSGEYVFGTPGTAAPYTMTITGTSPTNPRIGSIVGTVNLDGSGDGRGITIN